MTANEWARYSRAARKLLAPVVESGGARCWRCGQPVPPGSRWDADHIRPLVQGGDINDPSNIAVSHAKCNRAHGARLRQQKRTAVAVVPVRRPSL